MSFDKIIPIFKDLGLSSVHSVPIRFQIRVETVQVNRDIDTLRATLGVQRLIPTSPDGIKTQLSPAPGHFESLHIPPGDPAFSII
jgi:hypothetical protein